MTLWDQETDFSSININKDRSISDIVYLHLVIYKTVLYQTEYISRETETFIHQRSIFFDKYNVYLNKLNL